ncbi:MAG: ABC transporter permease [Alphaproteobacteria bacterium]|nr:ABC transporter permease [Alphaproteobacteria bacterium]
MGPRLATMAWRNLWRNKRRTLLTLASITFGTFLSVMFTAMQDRNFADMIDYAARLGGGHVTLQHPEYQDTPTLTRSIDHVDQLIALAQADPGVTKAVARVQGQAMVSTAAQSTGGFFLAFDPTAEDEDSLQLIQGLVAGRWFDGPDDKAVLLGRTLADNLEAELDDKVVYTVIDKHGEIAAGMGRLWGEVGTGAPSADGSFVMLPIDRVRESLGYGPTEATEVAIFLRDARKAPAVRDRLAGQLPASVVALTWDQVQPELSGFIAMKVGGARFMELVIMVLVAASIFNTLFVSVMERMREFGILIAIGYSPGQLFRLILWESAWLGLVGVALGALLTSPVYLYLVAHPIDVGAMTAGENMEVAGVGMPPLLRIGIFPENLALIGVFVVGATVLAGLYPAWRAGRVEPVEAINLV